MEETTIVSIFINMFEDYFNFLVNQVLEKINSHINGQIEVIKFAGKKRITVGGLIQSGGMVGLIWQKAIKAIRQPLTVNHCLILGLGGGTAANLINQSFPKAKITGVEIDKVMIELGKKYFNLSKIKNLKIINQDAIKFINKQQTAQNYYSLIMVDLYLGDKIPQKSTTVDFLTKLKKALNPKGTVIFNRLFYRQHKKETEKFINKLAKIFPKIKLIKAYSNLLVFASK